MRKLLVGIAMVLVLSGCGESPISPSASPAPSTPDAATRLLHTSILPPGARPATARVPAAAEAVACDPLETATSNWFVPDATLDSVSAYLVAHPSDSLAADETGSVTARGSITGKHVVDSNGSDSPRLVFTFQPATSGVDLRVDAQVVPKGSSCVGNQPAIIG